eukprot:g66304.t1
MFSPSADQKVAVEQENCFPFHPHLSVSGMRHPHVFVPCASSNSSIVCLFLHLVHFNQNHKLLLLVVSVKDICKSAKQYHLSKKPCALGDKHPQIRMGGSYIDPANVPSVHAAMALFCTHISLLTGVQWFEDNISNWTDENKHSSPAQRPPLEPTKYASLDPIKLKKMDKMTEAGRSMFAFFWLLRLFCSHPTKGVYELDAPMKRRTALSGLLAITAFCAFEEVGKMSGASSAAEALDEGVLPTVKTACENHKWKNMNGLVPTLWQCTICGYSEVSIE